MKTKPINAEWLKSIGIYPDERDPKHAQPEYSCRIVGSDDDGKKHSSDDDGPNDEIAELVIVPLSNGSAMCYIETWCLPSLNTKSLIFIGVRETQVEIIDLCRALKAWAIHYPE